MEAHQERVVEEKTELDYKMAKLGKYFESSSFNFLPKHEKLLLRNQFAVMEKYSDILGDRIKSF
jgi:hypothetical protein